MAAPGVVCAARQHAKAWTEVVPFLSKDGAEVRESMARMAAKLDEASRGSESLL